MFRTICRLLFKVRNQIEEQYGFAKFVVLLSQRPMSHDFA